MTAGRVNPNFTLEDQGITGLGNVYYNLIEPAIIEHALARKEGYLGRGVHWKIHWPVPKRQAYSKISLGYRYHLVGQQCGNVGGGLRYAVRRHDLAYARPRLLCARFVCWR